MPSETLAPGGSARESGLTVSWAINGRSHYQCCINLSRALTIAFGIKPGDRVAVHHSPETNTACLRRCGIGEGYAPQWKTTSPGRACATIRLHLPHIAGERRPAQPCAHRIEDGLLVVQLPAWAQRPSTRNAAPTPVAERTTLPEFATRALLGMLQPMAEARQPDAIIGGANNPYLKRWHLTPRGAGPAVYLHQFLRSDDDRALHDHPWSSVSIILAGRYVEHLPDGIRALRSPGHVIERDASSAHRVQLLPNPDTGGEHPCWTLFLVGDRVRDWGFHCPHAWIPWQQFTAGVNGELVGKGCDQ